MEKKNLAKKILEALNALEPQREQESRWYEVHYIDENVYRGKLVSDAEGNLISKADFYRIPVFQEDGTVRNQYVRAYRGSPIEAELNRLMKKGVIRESESWRYQVKTITKVMFVLESANRPKDGDRELRFGVPYLFVLRGKRPMKQLLSAVKLITQDLDLQEMEKLFDPFEESNRMSISYTKGQSGSLSLTTDLKRYLPPEGLPQELREFVLHELWLDTNPNFDPDHERHQELAEALEEAFLSMDRRRSEELPRIPKRREGSFQEEPVATPQEEEEFPEVLPMSSVTKISGRGILEHKGFIYEIGEDGLPVCFGGYDSTQKKCLNCKFVADCISAAD